MLANQTESSPLNETQSHVNQMPVDLLVIGSLFYSVVFVIGIVGNLLVLYVLSIEKDLRNFTNYLLANLSIADSLTLMICIPVGLHDLYAKERWYFGAVACYLIVFIESSLGVASILSIFFITLERFYVICRPLDVKSLMTQSRTLKLIIFIWFSSFIINSPFIHLSEYQLQRFNDNTEGYECLLKSDNQLPKIYIVSVSFLIYFFIGIVLIYMYVKIFTQLNKSTLYVFSFSNESKSNFSLIRRDFSLSNKSNSSDGTQKKQVKTTKPLQPEQATQQQQLQQQQQQQLINNLGNRRNTTYYKTSEGELILCRKQTMSDRSRHANNSLVKYIRLRRKLICMLIIVVAAFYICLFPLKIWNLTYMFFGYKQEFREVVTLRVFWTINIVVRTLFYINSSLNPILYNWLSAKFRYNFKKLLVFSRKRAEKPALCQY